MWLRFLWRGIVVAGFFAAFLPVTTMGEDLCSVQHPLMPPRNELSGQCSNCGMLKSMWARTWISFENSEGKFGVCSLHCLAHMSVKSGEAPKNIMFALYLEPEKLLGAEQAAFVVGSKAKGTMAMNSKIALASQEDARKFIQACGGNLMTFQQAYESAVQELPDENVMIVGKRIKSGKIVEPEDNKDECTVCRMYPARYPENKCQIQTADKGIYHFCSTRCMFTFLSDPASYAKKKVDPKLIWATDYPSGSWMSAPSAYYVVGSEVMGPMRREAFAFDRKSEARDFARQQGGTMLSFREVTIEKIKGKE